MLSVIGFLVILAPLVIVHELGHFLFAKLFNVKAEAFSVGFGPKLLAWKWGETEFKVSAIPLGGYVKLLGEEAGVELSEADRPRALQNQRPWKRFFIFFGGPLFNFIFAILVFIAILAIGEPQVGNVIGRVLPNTYAEKTGFRSGDRIVSIEGQPVRKMEEIVHQIIDHPGQSLLFRLERGSSKVDLKVVPQPQLGFSQYGEEKTVGTLDGLLSTPRGTMIGVSDPSSLAGKLGLRSGDAITALGGQAVVSWERIEALYPTLQGGKTLSLKVKDSTGSEKEVALKLPAKPTTLSQDFGIYPSELFIEKAVEDAPAAKAGLQKGDRLIAVDGKTLQSFFQLKELIQNGGEKSGKVKIEWERDGKRMQAEIEPTASTERDPALRKTTQYTIGVMPMLSLIDPEMIVERIANPFLLVYKGTERMLDFTWRNVVSLGKMFTGSVSVGTLGGPILIGKLAGDSLSKGLIAFLTTMAVLSVGLGILNILPVPVLDGGHILLLGIEAIRGRPLTLRQTEIVQQVGLSLVLLLMVVVIRNDLTRLPFFK